MKEQLVKEKKGRQVDGSDGLRQCVCGSCISWTHDLFFQRHMASHSWPQSSDGHTELWGNSTLTVTADSSL